MAKLSITLAQMQIVYGDQRRNLATLERLMTQAGASGRKSNMIVFPELWSTGYDLENAKAHASEMNKGMFAKLSNLATQHKIVLVGSLLEKRGIEVANSAPLFAPNGRMMGIYRKTHLFPLMEEDKYLQPGPSAITIDLPWGNTGIAICYDLRFPELFRKYVHNDATRLIVIPAEWPLERIDHWRALLIARAIENQCFIAACNAAGETNGTVFGGHSMIVDPWGKIVIEAGETPQLVTGEIELDEVDAARERIPVNDSLRFDIYQ
jgi:omega-amidase